MPARGASRGGRSRDAARGLVACCLAPASWRRNGLDSGRSAQQGDATPQRARGQDNPAVRLGEVAVVLQ
jgi:hypothetical protein